MWRGQKVWEEDTLHRFPSIKLNSERHKEWIRLMNLTTKRKPAWTPNDNGDMVCSEYFVDGDPSLESPNPNLKLGYEKKFAKRICRELVRKDVATPKKPSIEEIQPPERDEPDDGETNCKVFGH